MADKQRLSDFEIQAIRNKLCRLKFSVSAQHCCSVGLRSDDIKSDTVEFVLTKTYFENMGTIMQEYLTTTTVGDLLRKARGQAELPKSASQLLNKSASSAGAPNLDVGKERPVS